MIPGARPIAMAAAVLMVTAQAHAQGIGLPGQNRDKPIEIFADEGIEWQQKAQAYIARVNARAPVRVDRSHRQKSRSGLQVQRPRVAPGSRRHHHSRLHFLRHHHHRLQQLLDIQHLVKCH